MQSYAELVQRRDSSKVSADYQPRPFGSDVAKALLRIMDTGLLKGGEWQPIVTLQDLALALQQDGVDMSCPMAVRFFEDSGYYIGAMTPKTLIL